MNTVRLNISLPDSLFQELNCEVKPRQRSQFISTAITELLKQKKQQRLAAEYKEAAQDIRRINNELEGTISDGID